MAIRRLVQVFGAVVVAGLLAAAPAIASTPAQTPTVDEESRTTIAQDVIASYVHAADSLWTDPGALRGATRLAPTETLSVNAQVRDAMAEAGTPIVNAESTTDIIETDVRADGALTVRATISTSFSYGGDGEQWPLGSTWTDEHEIVIDTSGETPRVVTDRVIEPPVDSTPGTPEGYDPTPSSAVRPQATGAPGMTTLSQPNPDLYEMQGYALEWTLAPNDGDDASDFNPSFPRFDNNCANFASQVLRAGGWDYKGGVNPYDTANWSPNLTGPGQASRTWSSSKYQYTFVDNNGYDWLPNIWNATPGSLLYTDWDPNNTPDGEIDHVMVVVFADMGLPGGPLISQKTPNRGAIPLQQSIANATAQGKTIVWYGLQ